MEFDLQIMGNFKRRSEYFHPKLHVRVRKAIPEDFDFVKQLHAIKKSKKLGIYAHQSFLGPQAERVNILQRETKIEDGVKLVSTIAAELHFDGLQDLYHFSRLYFTAPSQAETGSRSSGPGNEVDDVEADFV